MGKLVTFSRRGRNSKAEPTERRSAEIVLFTGVRYQRDDAPQPDKPIGAAAAGRGKRRRG